MRRLDNISWCEKISNKNKEANKLLTERAVTSAKISVVGLGREDPVPAKLGEVDLERPLAALGHFGVILLRADPAGRPLDSGPPSSILDVDLKIGPLEDTTHS